MLAMAHAPDLASGRARGMNSSTHVWDAIVVGAGVAGGATAAMIAQRGWRVLLVERSVWPREKVCGGCLSASAIDTLREIGLDSALRHAEPTTSVVWESGGRAFEHLLPRGAAILRGDFDASVVAEAVRRGCEFMPGCSASLLPASSSDSYRVLKLKTGHRTIEARAGIVIACDGIGGALLAGEPWAKWTISPDSLIGVAATYQTHSDSISPGRIYMCMGNNGYVGMVRIDGSYEHLAAALDPASCRRAGGPVNLVREILGSCGRTIPAALDGARFRGTGTLTRRRKHFGGFRVLTVGDACGYVEPLTGEGMAWAAIGARELVNMLPNQPARWRDDLPARWRRRYLEVIGRQQRWCRGLRTTVRHPALAAAGIFVGSVMPALARWIAQTICEPPTKEIRDDNPGRFRVAQTPSWSDPGDIGHRHRQPAGSPAGVGA
jgi:menaquinone-9 beta-reductase